MMPTVRSLVLMFLVAMVTTSPDRLCTADDGNTCRPIKLKGTSTVAGNPFEGAPFFTEGTGGPLGRFTGIGFVEFGDPVDGIVEGSGTQTFIAANGDELETTFSGTLDLTTGTAVVDFVITGGTGRFEDATGEFTAFVQTIEDPTGQGQLTFSFSAQGEICY